MVRDWREFRRWRKQQTLLCAEGMACPRLPEQITVRLTGPGRASVWVVGTCAGVHLNWPDQTRVGGIKVGPLRLIKAGEHVRGVGYVHEDDSDTGAKDGNG